MTPSNKQVVVQLRLLADGLIVDIPSSGLCAYLRSIDREDLREYLSENVHTWKYYSGDLLFPVPNPSYINNKYRAEPIYHDWGIPKFLYGPTDNKYVLLRRDLCAWFADLIEDNLITLEDKYERNK